MITQCIIELNWFCKQKVRSSRPAILVLNWIKQFFQVSLTKYFSLFWVSVLLSKNIFIFKRGCLSGFNNRNLHLEIKKKKSGACKNFKIVFPIVLTIVALYVTLKQVIFFAEFFTMQLWKVNSNRDKSKLLLKYWMLYSANKVMCFISATGSIKQPQRVHYWAFLKSHHQNSWPGCEKVTWKNGKLRNTLEVKQK